MGTETEALRWKQWIDRWIKISSPESSTNTTPSLANSSSSGKVDSSSARKSLLTPEQLQYQLINMVKVGSSLMYASSSNLQEGDPVFCEGLARELLNNVIHFRLALKCLSGLEVSEVRTTRIASFLTPKACSSLLLSSFILLVQVSGSVSAKIPPQSRPRFAF